MRALVLVERAASAEVVEHLIEIDRRRLFLDQACSSLYAYCIERLGYSENGAIKRMRVARLAERVPCVLEELRMPMPLGTGSVLGSSDHTSVLGSLSIRRSVGPVCGVGPFRSGSRNSLLLDSRMCPKRS